MLSNETRKKNQPIIRKPISSTAGYLAGLKKNNPPAYACCKDLIGQYLLAAG